MQKEPSAHSGIMASEKEQSAPAQYADVALPLHVDQSFTYRLPDSMREMAQPGARIVVPFGRKLVSGYVVALRSNPREDLDESSIKDATELIDVVPLLSQDVLEITRWVAEYYAAPWGEVLKAALPPGITEVIEQVLLPTAKSEAERLRNQAVGSTTIVARLLSLIAEKGELALRSAAGVLGQRQAITAARSLEQAGALEIVQRCRTPATREKRQRVVRLISGAELGDAKLSEAQQRVVQMLADAGAALPVRKVLQSAEVSDSVIRTLQKKGLVEIFEEPVRRDPLAHASMPPPQTHTLTDAQSSVHKVLEGQLSKQAYGTFLLHGVTGSGKTEVYIRAMRTTLELRRSAMMLVPEIALTPVFSRRLRSQFGDQVAIFHSSLSKGERFDEWTRVKNGKARIVIGTRSAVFAPIRNLGLVIVDEEHESSYRQQDSPHYNARDTAIVRAQQAGAVVVLGSATPSLESFHNAHTGKYNYLILPDRIGQRPLASAQIIDMRDVFARHGKPSVFSEELLSAIDETHARHEQSIILLNRRGYSSFVLCRSCGESIECPNCDVTLTYHRGERAIVCHYCNYRRPSPTECPNCAGTYIYYVGEGTEQLEEMLGKQFPALRIARIDRDTTARRKVFEKSLFDFSEGKLDMLVGTQMLAKGHDFPNVTLVGVVSVDAGLALPDFRAAERTFQLITQVAGRAGRGERPGRVLIQTYHPDHYALRHACAQDYAGFYEEEIRHRRNHSYPPFVALASLMVHGPDLERTRNTALELRKQLDQANLDRACRVLGPAPAPLARLKGEHRIQLLIKSRSRRRLRRLIDSSLAGVTGAGHPARSINTEIDPISIM